jgi:hypothetical protein
MKIILIAGKSGHGKNSAANFIESNLKSLGYKTFQIAYSDYLKFICKQYFGWNGEKDEHGRELLQKVGTEFFRVKDSGFWVDAVIRYSNVMRGEYDYVLLTDVRFPNEINCWAGKGFDITTEKIVRPGYAGELTEEQKQHLSETALDNHVFDYVLTAGNLTELEAQCERFIIKHLWGNVGMNCFTDIQETDYATDDISIEPVFGTNLYRVSVESCAGFKTKAALYGFYHSLYETFSRRFLESVSLEDLRYHVENRHGQRVHIVKYGSFYSLAEKLEFYGTLPEIRDMFDNTLTEIYLACSDNNVAGVNLVCADWGLKYGEIY